MLAAVDSWSDSRGDLDRPAVSDEDLLQAIRRDLAAVYTDVLRAPIPDGIAAVLSRLENAFPKSRPTYSLSVVR